MLTKSIQRAHCRSVRKFLSWEEYRAECRKILVRASSVPALREAETVLSYWPKLEAREIDTRPLNSWLRARGCTVLLPMIEPNYKISRMHWGVFDYECALVPNRWGILEPARRAEISARGIDVVIVPGLGFDTRGHRIGYGQGYYDIMFTFVHAFKLGMIMDQCLLDRVPAEPHDVSVDCLVTSCKTFTFPDMNVFTN